MSAETTPINYGEQGHPIPLALDKLTKDVKAATVTLSPKEARFLVDLYYSWQDERIRQANQVRSLRAAEEPHESIAWV
ncbi:MAG TPA: hypothetical protein VGW38_06995, partial [Chloroflexota bacterium]|nr:hypothetical protein [Chloroflexota bacterium]